MTALGLDLLKREYRICRLNADEALPHWVDRSVFYSITRTPSELSVVCAADGVPAGTACEGPWRVLAVRGPLDFALTGVLASLASPLADAGISIFAISTYDTDYLLVRAGDIERAVQTLQAAGHRVFESA